MQQQSFRGWWIVAAAVLTFGLSTGLPYYNMPFFYDYYEKGFGWSRPDVVLGFPLAALFTLWVGPMLVHRFSPRMMILAGTGFTCLAFFGFSRMQGEANFLGASGQTGGLYVYYAIWFLYTIGYIFSGPIPHQVIISQWFRKNRGIAMGVTYVGVGLIGSLGSYLVKPLAESRGFQGALLIMGLMVLIAWPLALFVLKNRPADIGQNPDGAAAPPPEIKVSPRPIGELLRRPAFWLLVVGSLCSIGSIGSINQHMKLVFLDQGFTDQAQLNSTWRTASILILWSSIAGRLLIGWLADRYPKKYVMVATYLLVALTIPILLLVTPGNEFYLYAFALLFGFGMGADYMLIPLMAAEQFGVNSLARAMAIILPTDTIGQTWFPWLVAKLRVQFGDYSTAMLAVFAAAFIGAVAIALLPKHGEKDEPDAVPGAEGVPAK